MTDEFKEALAETSKVIAAIGADAEVVEADAVKSAAWVHAHWLWLVGPGSLIFGFVCGYIAFHK